MVFSNMYRLYWNYLTTNLVIYSNETSQDNLSMHTVGSHPFAKKLHEKLFISTFNDTLKVVES